MGRRKRRIVVQLRLRGAAAAGGQGGSRARAVSERSGARTSSFEESQLSPSSMLTVDGTLAIKVPSVGAGGRYFASETT